jgi:hypothetical protein
MKEMPCINAFFYFGGPVFMLDLTATNHAICTLARLGMISFETVEKGSILSSAEDR